MAKILAFAGSLRTGSYNKMMVAVAAKAAKAAGADVRTIDLRDLPLPLYDGDIESEKGLPDNAKKLKAMMKESDGFLIASPEYNSGPSAALKNAIDWASRPEPGEASLAAFTGKAVVLMSASPGGLGGLRGLAHVRSILACINMIVLPQQFALSKAHEAFDEKGQLKDAKQRETVEGLGKTLAEFLDRHVG